MKLGIKGKFAHTYKEKQMRRCLRILYIPPDSLCRSFSQTHSPQFNSTHLAISESSSSTCSLKFPHHQPPTISMAELVFQSLFAPTRQEQDQPCALNHAENRGIDLGLRLCSIDYDPWIIKKKLTVSDLGNLCRLLVPKSLTQNHVLPLMNKSLNDRVHSTTGETVTVYDNDMKTKHELVFKYWPSAKCYVLQANWKRCFVNGRKLKEGDLIGLYWDARSSIFVFSVIKQAA